MEVHGAGKVNLRARLEGAGHAREGLSPLLPPGFPLRTHHRAALGPCTPCQPSRSSPQHEKDLSVERGPLQDEAEFSLGWEVGSPGRHPFDANQEGSPPQPGPPSIAPAISSRPVQARPTATPGVAQGLPDFLEVKHPWN